MYRFEEQENRNDKECIEYQPHYKVAVISFMNAGFVQIVRNLRTFWTDVLKSNPKFRVIK